MTGIQSTGRLSRTRGRGPRVLRVGAAESAPYTGVRVEGCPPGCDPGLPDGDLQAPVRERAHIGVRAGPPPECLAGLRERDGEEARGARARRPPALRRGRPHRLRGTGPDPDHPAPPSARAL